MLSSLSLFVLPTQKEFFYYTFSTKTLTAFKYHCLLSLFIIVSYSPAEPATSATPKLASLLHTYFSQQIPSSTKVAGSRHMHVQPTAIARRRDGISNGSKLAPAGRPPKRPLDFEQDPSFQTKRGQPDHVKRKQNLRQNELKNQTNHHRHGRGH